MLFADAFRDGRVLIGITQFDNNYHVSFEEERITEEYARQRMCTIIEAATRQQMSQIENVVLTISGMWALCSIRVQGVDEDQFPREFNQRKDVMLSYLNNSQEVMENLTGGQDENVPLSRIEPLKLASMLHNASHIEEFTRRYMPK